MATGNKTAEVARKNGLFSRVKEARELLKNEAENILKLHMQIIQEARMKGDHETALKGTMWLIEHMPADEGTRLVDVSVDKVHQDDGPKGPQIQIGIALGGMPNSQKLLPTVEVIEIKEDE